MCTNRTKDGKSVIDMILEKKLIKEENLGRPTQGKIQSPPKTTVITGEVKQKDQDDAPSKQV